MKCHKLTEVVALTLQRQTGQELSVFEVGAGVVFGGTKPLVFDQKHFSFPKNSVVLRV